MSKHFGTIRNLIAITALALAGAAGCATDGESSVESSSTGRGTGGDEAPGDGTGPSAGGSCDDLLVHGCDGATGEKLEVCKADLQNAYAECLKFEACQAQREAVAKLCAPKDEACLAKADQVFYDCVGPTPAPGTQPRK